MEERLLCGPQEEERKMGESGGDLLINILGQQVKVAMSFTMLAGVLFYHNRDE